MRSLSLALLALLAIAELCVAQLEPPKNLQVAQISPHIVILGWEWEKANVPLAEVKFTIVEATNQIDKVTVKGKLQAKLEKLEAGKNYSVSITASFSGDSSEPLVGNFSALTEDWPAPTEVHISAGQRETDQVFYTASWTFNMSDPLSKNLTKFSIECAPSCGEKTAEPNARNVSIPLSYYADYTVTVSAVYVLPMGLNHTAKKKVELKTEAGTPGPVTNALVQQTPDTLDLNITWSPPAKPNGAIVNYTVQLLVSSNNSEIVELQQLSTQLSYEIPLSAPIVDAYIVRIRAVNNAEPAFRNGTFQDVPFNLQKPEPPQAVNFTERTATSLKFDIQRATTNAALYFRITTSQGNVTNVTASKSVTLVGFTPFTAVTVLIRSCLPLKDKAELCGKDQSFETKTNVDAPSEVQKLDVVYPNGKPKVTWQAPAIPAGPIDGYLVRFYNSTNDPPQKQEDIGKVLEYSPSNVVNCTKYSFEISAFNYDLDTKEKRIGNSTIKTIPGCGSTPKAFPKWAIILIVLILLAAAGGAAFYFLKVRRYG